MRLIIGSAQFGKKYGIKKNKINNTDIGKISNICLKNKIHLIDTAENYGESEKIIGKSSFKKFKIITKIIIPKNLKNNDDLIFYLNNYIEKTLNKLKTKKIYSVLIHDISVFKTLNKNLIINFFHTLKKKKILQYFGASVYSPQDVKFLLKFWKPDILQFPLNILDQRFVENRFLNFLKKKNIILISRSVFLQGFLLQDLSRKKNFELKKFKKVVVNFDNWCKFKKISRLEACIKFIKNFKNIDYSVIGFDNHMQLVDLIKVFKDKRNFRVSRKFKTKNLNLIDPRRWRI